MIHEYKLQYDDSLHAIEMDDQYIKAFVCNGEALIMLA
jgi:hypothetical protein